MGWRLAVAISRLGGRDLSDLIDEIYGSPQQLLPSEISAAQALYPRNRRNRYALAYEGFGWIFDWKLFPHVLKRPLPIKPLLSTFVLQSTVNWYGFSIQEDGAFLRCREGDTDNGITNDDGTPSAAERALVAAQGKPEQGSLAWNAWCDASTSFDGTFDSVRHDVMGEGVVFGLMKELVGFRLDEASPHEAAFMSTPVLSIMKSRPKTAISWLFR